MSKSKYKKWRDEGVELQLQLSTVTQSAPRLCDNIAAGC